MPITPQEHEIRKAGTGAGMVVTSAWWASLFSHAPLMQQQAAQLSSGHALSQGAQIVAGGAALFFVTGLVLLSTGAKRSRGSRDVRVAGKALLWTGAAALLLAGQAFVADSPFFNFLLTTIYVWTLASGLTRLYLAMRGMPEALLPDPEELGLPVSGPATRDEAIASMQGKGDWKPPRFSR
jgi:hypothetical protein